MKPWDPTRNLLFLTNELGDSKKGPLESFQGDAVDTLKAKLKPKFKENIQHQGVKKPQFDKNARKNGKEEPKTQEKNIKTRKNEKSS